jgi:hypothetical protein
MSDKNAGALAGMVPLGMAAAGAALAPEGETAQGAALGLGAGLLTHQAGQAVLSPFKRVGQALQRTPTVPTTMHAPKIAGFNVGIQGPNSPVRVSYNFDDKEPTERLNGMNRWVPRSLLEKAMQGRDAGVSPDQLIHEAGHAGEFSMPLSGAALGAAVGGAVGGMRDSTLAGSLIGGLSGGVLGHLSHRAGRKEREANMAEAVKGVSRMPGVAAPIITGQRHHTAAEAQPQLLFHAYTE